MAILTKVSKEVWRYEISVLGYDNLAFSIWMGINGGSNCFLFFPFFLFALCKVVAYMDQFTV